MVETKYKVYFPFCLFSGLPNPPGNSCKTLQPTANGLCASLPPSCVSQPPHAFLLAWVLLGHRINQIKRT